jgi:nitrogen-specific signal transduction histidine kinase/CheY-like chemotaxis protein
MGISLDVTSRVELENRLREAAKMEAVGALAAGVAHDFNNYLTVMALQLGSISTTLEGQHASAIKPLEDAIEQSATLTRQLLAFARKQPRVVRSVDMRALIETSASLFGRAAGPNVSIELRLPPDPLHVLGDPCQLDSVLMNLALNARDATSGRGTVTISLESQRLEPRDPRLPPAAASGSYVVITVRDDGVGIAPEHLPRLFEPYFSTKAAGRGTGLGLASVYGIATQHGGFVHVETAPEKGSSFLVYLPATDTLPTDTPEQCTAERDVLSGTVLVVEDMAPLREVAARILAETGLEVRIAATAGEALRVVSSALQIDLVLSDVVMPGASGFDLARQVREIAPQTSVVFMSGYADGALLERIEREAPGCPLVRKPFDTAELLGVVGRALKKARAR